MGFELDTLEMKQEAKNWEDYSEVGGFFIPTIITKEVEQQCFTSFYSFVFRSLIRTFGFAEGTFARQN